MIGISSDDLLYASVLTFALLYFWDSLNRKDAGPTQNINSSPSSAAARKPGVSATKRASITESTPKKAAKSASSVATTPAASTLAAAAASASATATPAATSTSVVLPHLPGCEPDGKAAIEMQAKYPDTSIADIVRYLVARKGNVAAASEMLEKCNAWRAQHFPLKRSDMQVAYETGAFFYHGKAKDGTPVIYFRGGLYDKNKASAETYVLGAAHCIDVALRHASTINVTVLVHTANVDGGVNASADMNFIKAFVAVLSDNYPERLKRLILYPFPWWGRSIWSVVKMFVDKRTQDKVVLLSGEVTSNAPPPKELFDYVDAKEIPPCCGGVDKRPIAVLADTLTD